MKTMVKPDNRTPYYVYLLCYVYGILSISHDSTSVIEQLDKYFRLNPGLLGDPYIYLVFKLKPKKFHNLFWCRYLSSTFYLKKLVKNAEKYLKYLLCPM